MSRYGGVRNVATQPAASDDNSNAFRILELSKRYSMERYFASSCIDSFSNPYGNVHAKHSKNERVRHAALNVLDVRDFYRTRTRVAASESRLKSQFLVSVRDICLDLRRGA